MEEKEGVRSTKRIRSWTETFIDWLRGKSTEEKLEEKKSPVVVQSTSPPEKATLPFKSWYNAFHQFSGYRVRSVSRPFVDSISYPDLLDGYLRQSVGHGKAARFDRIADFVLFPGKHDEEELDAHYGGYHVFFNRVAVVEHEPGKVYTKYAIRASPIYETPP